MLKARTLFYDFRRVCIVVPVYSVSAIVRIHFTTRSGPDAFDFDSDARSIGEYIQLFDADPDRMNSVVRKASRSNFFCQRFDQIDMASAHNVADCHGDFFVTDHVRQAVLNGLIRLRYGKVNIDPHALMAVMFVAVDADHRIQHKIADEDLANSGAIR